MPGNLRRRRTIGAGCSTALTLVVLAACAACATSDAPPPLCVVSTVNVAPVVPPMHVGTSATLSATAIAAHCNAAQLVITWSSSAPAVASVTPAGELTALSAGTTTVRASVAASAASIDITVLHPVASVSVTPASGSVVQGGTLSFVATLRDALGGVLTDRAVSWSSSTPSVATVRSDGLVTGVAVGAPVTITATSEQRSGSATVAVVPPPRLQLSNAMVAFLATAGAPSPAAKSVTITNGGGGELSGLTAGPVAYGPGANGWLQASLSGTSASPSATLSLQPAIGALTPGSYTATLPVSADGALGSPQLVQVSLLVRAAAVGSVVVAPGTVLLAVGAKQQLTATVRDSAGAIVTGRAVQWSSTNLPVAAVDAGTGLVTAASVGVASIVATVDGVTGVAFVYTGAVSAYDGTWHGQAGSGRTFTMTVTLGRIAAVVIGVGIPPGAPCPLSYSASPLTLISGNAFAFSTSGGTSNTAVSGSFLSATSAQGTYGTITFDRFVCPSNLVVTGTVPGGSWSAAKP